MWINCSYIKHTSLLASEAAKISHNLKVTEEILAGLECTEKEWDSSEIAIMVQIQYGNMVYSDKFNSQVLSSSSRMTLMSR